MKKKSSEETTTKTKTKAKNMDQTSEPSTSKAKGISELHFNAISNASFRSNKSTSDQSKLLPSNQKYVITPISQQSAPTQLNGGHKTVSSPSEGPSTDPSSTTSPILSPITTRPKHYNSTRSLRSGLFIKLLIDRRLFYLLFNYA